MGSRTPKQHSLSPSLSPDSDLNLSEHPEDTQTTAGRRGTLTESPRRQETLSEQEPRARRKETLMEGFGLGSGAGYEEAARQVDRQRFGTSPYGSATQHGTARYSNQQHASPASTDYMGQPRRGRLGRSDSPASSELTGSPEPWQRDRSSSSPVAHSTQSSDAAPGMKICSVRKSIVDSFEAPRSEPHRDFPMMARGNRPRPRQHIEPIDSDDSTTDDTRHSLFALVPVGGEEQIRSLDSAPRRRPGKSLGKRAGGNAQGQGLAEFLHIGDQQSGMSPSSGYVMSPSSGYGTGRYLQNTD